MKIEVWKSYTIFRLETNPCIRIALKLAFIFSWVQTNYPTYYSKFREAADPVATFVWQKLTVAATFIAKTTKPARDYVNAKIPELLEKVKC